MGAALLGAVLRRLLLVVDRQAEEQGDRQLLDVFITKKDEAAFAALMERYGRLVFGVCRSVLHHEQDAEDAFQATFLVLVRKAASVRPRELVGNWLYGVAYRTALKARSAAAHRRAREKQVIDMPDEAEPEVHDDWRPLLDRELNRLPEKYRAAVVLCHLEGKSYAQAARELGWPKSSLASRLAKAHKVLRVQLARRGFALSAGAVATALAEKATAAPVAVLSAINIVKAAASVAAGRSLPVRW